MATLSVENYVKTIYHICEETDVESATTTELSRRLGVAPASVTGMLRTLAEAGLADYQIREGVKLTEAGLRLALRVIRGHRLIELFLVKTLGLSWDEVHEEAEHWEHVVSDRVIERIEEILNHPERDPHGDPIPRADGTLPEVGGKPLVECEVGAKVILERILDQSPDFLRYLTNTGLGIGSTATVIENDPHGGVLVIRSAGKTVTFSRDVASKVLVGMIN